MTGESLVVIEAPGPEEIFLRTEAVSTASQRLTRLTPAIPPGRVCGPTSTDWRRPWG